MFPPQGKWELSLRGLCEEISRKEDIQGIRILECESYTEGSLPPHIYLVLPLNRRKLGDSDDTIQVPDAWLRLDRRMAKGPVWRFIFASSRSAANDQVCLVSTEKNVKVA